MVTHFVFGVFGISLEITSNDGTLDEFQWVFAVYKTTTNNRLIHFKLFTHHHYIAIQADMGMFVLFCGMCVLVWMCAWFWLDGVHSMVLLIQFSA